VKDEWLIGCNLDEASQVVLLFPWVDKRIFVVIKEAKEAIQTNVHAGRLDEFDVQRVEANAAGLNLGADIAI
jgi:hypothetical protein